MPILYFIQARWRTPACPKLRKIIRSRADRGNIVICVCHLQNVISDPRLSRRCVVVLHPSTNNSVVGEPLFCRLVLALQEMGGAQCTAPFLFFICLSSHVCPLVLRSVNGLNGSVRQLNVKKKKSFICPFTKRRNLNLGTKNGVKS